MTVTIEQVAQLAPDEKAVASARQLLNLLYWSELGFNATSIWGTCQGATHYAVRVDLTNLGNSCNCPSRKRPCRHVLGLLMLLASSPDAIPIAAPPPEVTEWLERRRQRAEKQASKAEAPKTPVDTAGREKRNRQREARVREGISQLQLWLCDLIRTGLAGVEAKGEEFWEAQARRLVDAQAPGLANRVRRLAEIPGRSIDWPQQLLSALGKLELLLLASEQIDTLPEDLQWDVRQLQGWTIPADELDRVGREIADTWIVIGQSEEEDDRFRTRRTWLQSTTDGEFALILQFAPGHQPFAQNWITGSKFDATVLFYPGTIGRRAKLLQQGTTVTAFDGRLRGVTTVENVLKLAAAGLARLPWLPAIPIVIKEVTIVPFDGKWYVRDQIGVGLPLDFAEPWRLLAMSGGGKLDLFGEWNGSSFAPLSILQNQQLLEPT